jgi:hypothetical protein
MHILYRNCRNRNKNFESVFSFFQLVFVADVPGLHELGPIMMYLALKRAKVEF